MHGMRAAAPAYRRFVTLHVDAMSTNHADWSVYTMQMGCTLMRGRNFLSWHRRILKLFEDSLQKLDPAVTIPYWDSITDRAMPNALDDKSLLKRWSVTRNWNAFELALPLDLVAVKNYTGTFTGFQTLIENVIHAGTHNAIGGNMASPASPTDPLFWLHHAFLDKIWSDWQTTLNAKNPPLSSQCLKPTEMEPGVAFGVRVSSLLKTNSLGYSYA